MTVVSRIISLFIVISDAFTKRHLEVELHCSSLWVWLHQRVMVASTEYSSFPAAIAFSLGKLGLSRISLKKEQRSAILVEYQSRDVPPNRKSMCYQCLIFLMDYKH